MRFTWGHAIFLVMTAFVLLMGWFMVRAMHNPEELVAENYYQKELRYQQDIDAMARTREVGGDARIMEGNGVLTITFPASVRASDVAGRLQLLRPSDARADTVFQVLPDTAGICRVDVSRLMKGAYCTSLDWTVDGRTYLTRGSIYLR